MSAAGPSPFYESPWFWGYSFCAAVLAGLLLFGDRIADRQSQLENQYHARQEHGQSIVPPGEREAWQQSEDPLIGMSFYYVLAGAGFVICWGVFLYERIYLAAGEAISTRPEADPPPEAPV